MDSWNSNTRFLLGANSLFSGAFDVTFRESTCVFVSVSQVDPQDWLGLLVFVSDHSQKIISRIHKTQNSHKVDGSVFRRKTS